MGSLLSANALDLAGLALHHVLSQTVGPRPGHAARRDQRGAAAGDDGGDAAARARSRSPRWPRRWAPSRTESRTRIEALGGGRRGLGELGADRAASRETVEAAMARGELAT